jgi:FAD/FMN-containing dehydrogenase
MTPDILISELRATLDGEVLAPADAGFATARAEAIWNGGIARQPTAIVRPTSAEDVARAITTIRKHGADLTVRGGGHSGAGNAVAEDAVMIDLSRMNDVRVDPGTRRAYVGGGATLAALDAATAPHGLAVIGGTVSHTGVAGLTLSGGMGWLLSRQGLSCDNLVAATLVTADGRVVPTSEEAEPDLFWALRGAGTNFGVVTELVFGLHEVDPMAQLGLFFWRAEDAAEPLALAREHFFSMPDSLGAVVVGLSAPPEPFVPAEHHGVPGVALIVVGWGDQAEHAAAIEPLRRMGPLFELVTPIPYVALQQMLDEANPWGIRAYDKGINLDELSDEAIATVLEWLPRKASSLSYLPIFPLRGRYREVPEDATAFGSSRSSRWAVSLIAMAPDEESFAADRVWARNFFDALRPFARDLSTYVNFEADADEGRVRASYGDAKYGRLSALKAIWDPDNVFHHNANIRPAAAAAGGIPGPRPASETPAVPAS